MLKKNILLCLILFSISVFSQTKKEVENIIKKNNIKQLTKIKLKLEKEYKLQQKKINEYCLKNNVKKSFKKDGVVVKIKKILPNGKPLYYQLYNKHASESTRADFLYNNGGLGLNIEGQNMNAFVWDGGHSNINHTEFMVNGSSKITVADSSNETDIDNLNHATHVIGTIIARGANLNARGMAPQASGYTLDWNNDAAEAISATNFGMLVSNHSYGPDAGNLPDWMFGAYTSESKVWDEIMFNAPYYVMVVAAGNDGFDFTSNSIPIGGNPQYDKLSGHALTKNGISVANGNDANVGSNGDIISGGTINLSSSQGPTDDLRVKPDITGNGTNLYSSIYTSATAYDSYTGTSMASPSVVGSLLLLQQLYNQENNNYMLAATLKGLALHTADDFGAMGPDPKYGWGYMNTKKAAETIIDNSEIINESTLNDGDSKTFDVVATGSESLIASISWTDPALSSTVNNGVANDTTPVLVNDLDIRITDDFGNTYYPWKLTSVTTNTKADNTVDPFEKIEIENPISNRTYHVAITHKGTLHNGLQNYSTIVTGISSTTLSTSQDNISDFNIYPNPSNGEFTINLGNSNLTKFDIYIYNNLGKIVYKKQNLNEISYLKLNNLTSGIYNVKIINNNQIKTKKLIIK